jgi:hypothetical protein
MTNNYFKVSGKNDFGRITSELFFFDDKERSTVDDAHDRAYENLNRRSKAQLEGELSLSVFRAFATTSKSLGLPLVGFDGPYALDAEIKAAGERLRRIESNRRLAYKWAMA